MYRQSHRKCDENFPTCLRCKNAKRECIREVPSAVKPRRWPTFRRFEHFDPKISQQTSTPSASPLLFASPPLSASPPPSHTALCGSDQLALEYFFTRTLPFLNTCRPTPLWNQTVAALVQSTETFRHIAAAIGEQHRILCDRRLSEHAPGSVARLPTALYAKAILSVRHSLDGWSDDNATIPSLACLLMIVLETARESGSGALVHLNCGIRFVCRNRLYTTSFDLLEVARLLRAYGVNVILHEPIAPASTAIQKLLLGTDQLPTDHEEVENVISEFYNIIIELVPVRREQELHHFQSEAKSAFENISTITKLHTRFAEALERLEQLQASRSEATPEGRRLKILRARKILLQLELQHSRRTVKQDTRANRLYAEALELIDASLQQLCRSIGDVVPPFLFGVGLLPGIRSVALECRDPVVRRKALETFRRYPVQEGVWNARRQLRVCKTIIGFEDVTPGQMVVHHQLGPEHTVLGEPDSLTIFCISTAHPPEHTVHQIPLISE